MNDRTNVNSVGNGSSSSDWEDELLCMAFNQDGGCLAVGTGKGFRICNVTEFQETFRREHPITSGSTSSSSSSNVNGVGVSVGSPMMSSNAGIVHMEMLFRCNLLALVCQAYPQKVYIWDDHLGRPIGELSFRQKVLGVKLCRDRICVTLRDRIYVYNFGNLKLLDTIVTGDNPRGLLCIATESSHPFVLACPNHTASKGQVRLELYGERKTNFVQAHDHALAAMALTVDGQFLVTASERGTVLRVFHTANSNLLQEFRRGVERANISCLAFSLDKTYLASAGSDRGTVHIFQLSTNNNNANPNNSTASRASTAASTTKKWAKRLLSSATTQSSSTSSKHSSHVSIRGIPHPQLCAFVPDQPKTIAIAGLDEYGNGCLLLANFFSSSSTPTTTPTTTTSSTVTINTSHHSNYQRIAYHRFFKKQLPTSTHKSKHHSNHNNTNNTHQYDSNIYMQDHDHHHPNGTTSSNAPRHQMEQITFDENAEDDFVNIIDKPPPTITKTTTTSQNQKSQQHDQQTTTTSPSSNTIESTNNNNNNDKNNTTSSKNTTHNDNNDPNITNSNIKDDKINNNDNEDHHPKINKSNTVADDSIEIFQDANDKGDESSSPTIQQKQKINNHHHQSKNEKNTNQTVSEKSSSPKKEPTLEQDLNEKLIMDDTKPNDDN